MTTSRSSRGLILLVAAVAVVALLMGWRSYGAYARDSAARALYAPIIVSASTQPVAGQAFLFKLTNISVEPVGITLQIFGESSEWALESTEFPKIAPKMTETHLYTPPMGKLVLNGTTYEAPVAVRAIVGPLTGGDQNAVRKVVASMQLVNLKPATANILKPAAANVAPTLDPPVAVPLERCRFEPTGFVPYTGARYVWNCAPGM